MDYNAYNAALLQVQKDYIELNDTIAKIKQTRLEKYMPEGGLSTSEKQELEKKYSQLNSKIFATAVRLKDYFVENNEDFNEVSFMVSLSFFNGYSIMENTPLLVRGDYERLNADFLELYKRQLQTVLVTKKEQYDAVNKMVKEDRVLYKKEFASDLILDTLLTKETQSHRAKAIRARYQKNLYQRENLHKKVHFIKKEYDTITSVLEQSNIKDMF